MNSAFIFENQQNGIISSVPKGLLLFFVTYVVFVQVIEFPYTFFVELPKFGSHNS